MSCADKKNVETPVQTVAQDSDTIAKASFFPVTAFIKGQMLPFDSMHVTPLLITTAYKKIDSQWLKQGQIKPLLQTFLSPEINDSNLIKYYKESKFNDQTINAITLTYDPITALPDSMALLTWNVYIDPEKGTVTKIYIVKHLIKDGRYITQQLTWRTDKYAQITELTSEPGNNADEILKQQKIIWNFDQ